MSRPGDFPETADDDFSNPCSIRVNRWPEIFVPLVLRVSVPRGETVFSFFVLARPLSFRFHAYRPKSLCKPNLF